VVRVGGEGEEGVGVGKIKLSRIVFLNKIKPQQHCFVDGVLWRMN